MKLESRLAIIIVEFNAPKVTIECINSIEKYLNIKCKIYLYDNSDLPSSELKLKLEKSNIDYEYSFNGSNIGFAKACNLGIIKSKQDGFNYSMLLNSDTVLIDDSPINAINYFQKSQDIGVLGIINYYYDYPNKIWQSGKNLRKSMLGFKNVKPSKGELTYCDYVPGSSLIINLDIIEKVGLLDENYFAYYEEIDFCFKLKKEGFKIAYINDSKLLHHVGASSKSNIKTYLKTRNKLYFYNKIHKNKIFFLITTFIILTKDCLVYIKNDLKLSFTPYIYFGIKDFRRNNMNNNRFKI